MKQIFNKSFCNGSVEQIYNDSRDTKLKEIMTKNLHTVRSETSLCDVVNIMIDFKLKRIPVTDDGHLIGLITRKDIVKAFSMLKDNTQTPDISTFTL